MFPSQSVLATAKTHRLNQGLQAPYLGPAARSAHDLSIEYPSPSPHPSITERAAQALQEGNTHYAPVAGIDPLRTALALYLSRLGIEGWEGANIVVTASLQEARFLAIQMVGEMFGHIVLPQHVHPGAWMATGVRKLDVIRVESDDRGLPSLAGIRARLDEGRKLFYFESPSRLTGASFEEQEARQIATWLEEFDGYAIVDQGLAPWTTEEHSLLATQPGMAQRLAVVGEAWPGMGLESWQVGYIGANQEWVAAVQKQKQIMSICTSTPSQFAALAASERWDTAHAEQVEALRTKREEVSAALRDLGAEVLSGDAVGFVAARAAGGSIQAGLERAGFMVADGNDFGAPGLFRLAVTLDGTTVEALAQLNRQRGQDQS